MAEHTKTLHVLPQNVVDTFQKHADDSDVRNTYIVALRRRGWTLQSIADASGITRERVRQIAKNDDADTRLVLGFPLPSPPLKPEHVAHEYIEPSEETLKRLLELQPDAQKVRGKGTKYRREAEEYTELLNYAHTVEGVTLYRLAKRLGVTHGALRFRLARYGYKKFAGTSRVYTPINEEHRLRD